MVRSSDFYRKITPPFFSKTGIPEFKIYVKSVEDASVERFIHEANYSPATHQDTLDMLSSNPDKEFFVHEDTLIHHYQGLLKMLQGSMGRLGEERKQLKVIYLLAEEVMREYLEKIDSSNILRVQDDVFKALDQFLMEHKFTFADIFKVTNKDCNMNTHCVNVGLYSMVLGMAFHVDEAMRRDLFLGGMFSDIGKKFIPDKIKFKKEKLTADEFKEIRKHPAAARMILNSMKHYPDSILQMVDQHHEKFNSRGYPRGLGGERIVLQARIGSLMDVFSALTSDRTHRGRLGPHDVFLIMKNEMSGSFDERIFANFIKMLSPVSPSAKSHQSASV